MNLLGAMPKRFTARPGIRVSLAKQQQRGWKWEKEKGSLTLARDPFLKSSRHFSGTLLRQLIQANLPFGKKEARHRITTPLDQSAPVH